MSADYSKRVWVMNKFLVFILFVAFALLIVVSNLYVLSPGFQEIEYPKYREEYAYNLKNPLIERYRELAIESPVEVLED